MSAIHFDRPGAFSADECSRIVALGEAAGLAPATVYGGDLQIVPSVLGARMLEQGASSSPAPCIE